jgi:beta-mannosidase
MFILCSFTGHSKINLDLKWEVGIPNQSESPGKYFPATIPGAVQLDIAKFGQYPSYTISDHYKKFEWMEDMFYTYRTSFKKPAFSGDERLFFVSRGIDYQFEIYLNDRKIFEQEGMFTYVDIDLTDQLKENNTLKYWSILSETFSFPCRQSAEHRTS